jgi:hypothetical protein
MAGEWEAAVFAAHHWMNGQKSMKYSQKFVVHPLCVARPIMIKENKDNKDRTRTGNILIYQILIYYCPRCPCCPLYTS